MTEAPDSDLAAATGLALALIAAMVERESPIPRGEVSRCMKLLAKTAAADRPRQSEILTAWAQIMANNPSTDRP